MNARALTPVALLTVLSACFGDARLKLSGQGSDPDAPLVIPTWDGPDAPPPVVLDYSVLDTPLRRLTRLEYENSLGDLLHVGADEASGLPDDPSFKNFDNNAELLTVDVLAIDGYDRVATAVVDRALASGSLSRQKLVPCNLAADGAPCARSAVEQLAYRAWRRPVAAEEIDRVLTALDDARAEGEGVEEGLRLAFRRVLLSASFLYRVEIDPPSAGPQHPLDAFELATRLSFFLWATIPDDELLALAEDGTLAQPPVFAAQVARMLDDPRADALVSNYAAQWLDTRALEDTSRVMPNAQAFPDFDEPLRAAMADEALLFFRAFLRSDRNVVDMLETDFTFADARLARHYGLGAVQGTGPQQISSGANRFGLLSQGNVLTLTSTAVRSSPTRRGQWVLTRVLCSPPPPAPANVPPLDDDATGQGLPANATIRQRMERHRAEPRCAGCHAVMDPIGFAMEHYDGVGAWRDAYPDNSIDATGAIPGGITFDGAHELSRALKGDPRVSECFTKNLFTYAFGRVPKGPDDAVAVEVLTGELTKNGGRVKALISALVTSKAFQRRGGAP